MLKEALPIQIQVQNNFNDHQLIGIYSHSCTTK